jgi:hypothetical protein
LVDLPQIWQFADLRFLDQVGICDLQNQFSRALKTAANPKIHHFFAKNISLKALTDHLGGGSREDSFDPQ